MPDEKVAFFGTLDVAARTLEEVPKPLSSLWNTGQYRMREGDIRRLEAYLKRARKAVVSIQSTLNSFKQLNSI